MRIASCHYRLLTVIMLPGISRVRAHTLARARIVIYARGNDASYMLGVLEIAHFESIVYDVLGTPSFSEGFRWPRDFSQPFEFRYQMSFLFISLVNRHCNVI